MPHKTKIFGDAITTKWHKFPKDFLAKFAIGSTATRQGTNYEKLHSQLINSNQLEAHMSINLRAPKPELDLKPHITVFGVGGAGCNAVNNMIQSNLEGVEFVVTNTDAQSLTQNLCENRIQLGLETTQGLGAGSRPDAGRAAAEESAEEIYHQIEKSNMVFITAGMGGGTGTGAAPVIAKLAKDQGVLTVGVITKPFQFEGAHRMRIAEAGIEELTQHVDTLIIIPNQNLFRIANEKTTFADAFKMADDVLYSGVRGVTDLMIMPGLINLDFADIRTVMSEMGKAMMGTGEASGERRAIDATEAAISNPLLEDISMKGARGVLINITGGLDMTLFEVDEAANRIREEVDPEANIIFGSTFDQNMEGIMRVSVVATGIDIESQLQKKPEAHGLNFFKERAKAMEQKQSAMQPSIKPNDIEHDETAVQPQERAALGLQNNQTDKPSFIPKQHVDNAADQLELLDEIEEAAKSKKKSSMGFFERMTGRNQQAKKPEQELSGPSFGKPTLIQTADSEMTEEEEEDLLEIPAFLRRQAN
jgi:cell division protein FtsZ